MRYGVDYRLYGVAAWRPGSDPGRPTRDDYGAGAELERHLSGGLTSPLPPAVPGHGACLVEHSHEHHHSVPGAEDDVNHSHLHTHRGDASHDHHQPADVLGDRTGVLMPGAEPGDLLVWQLAASLDTDWRPADVRAAMRDSDDPDQWCAAVCAAMGSGRDLSRWGLPHHDAPDLPPVAAAVRLAWGALRRGDGVPAGADVARARAHLEGHLREVNPLWPLEASGLTLAVLGLTQPGDWDAS